MLVAAAGVNAEPVALVVGIGATREPSPADPAPADGATVVQASRWRIRRCPAARKAAEEAFRELTPEARNAVSLYAHRPVWEDVVAPFRVSVLLTDGINDNRFVPSARVVAVQSRLLRSRAGAADDVVIFLSGMGEAEGVDSWVFDRLGGRIPVRRLLDVWEWADAAARRVCLMQIHSPSCAGPPRTLWISDRSSVQLLSKWTSRAVQQAVRREPVEPAGDRLPGLSGAVDHATPPRLNRLLACVQQAREEGPARWVVDLTEGIERQEQVVQVQVDRRVEPVYRVDTVRKPGPLFTILEEEVKTQIGVRTVVARDALNADMGAARLKPAAAEAIAGVLSGSPERSFDEVVKSGGVGYDMVFDASTGRLTITYLD
jgi:hypothetical protein